MYANSYKSNIGKLQNRSTMVCGLGTFASDHITSNVYTNDVHN